MVQLRREAAFDVVGGQETVGIGQRPELHPRVPRGGGVLVAVNVGTLAAEDLGAGAAEQAERELVRHRSRRHVERGLLPEQRRRERLEPADRGVLAVRVVADFGVGDGAPHLGRGRGDGVGPEVDGSRR